MAIKHKPHPRTILMASLAVVALLLWLLIQFGGDLNQAAPTSPQPPASPSHSRAEANPSDPTTDLARGPAEVPHAQDLAPGASTAISGQVLDAVGMAVSGARITSWPTDTGAPREALEQAADQSGNFTVNCPPDTAFELVFSHPGYRPSRAVARAPTSGLTVILERSPSLAGRVVQIDGSAVNRAFVRWSTPRLPPEHGGTTVTNANGYFEFHDLPQSIDLEVFAPDSLPVHRTISCTWQQPEILVVLDAGRTVRGLVSAAENGAGLANAQVELWYYGSTYTGEGRRGGASQLAETVTTDPDGGFTLTRLPSRDSSYSNRWLVDTCLWVTAPGRAPHWRVLADSHRAQPAALHFSLHCTSSVQGRVLDQEGYPIAGVRVYAEASAQPLCDAGSNLGYRRQHTTHAGLWGARSTDDDAPFHREREAITDASGNYRIDGLPSPPEGGSVVITLHDRHPAVEAFARPGRLATAPDLIRSEDPLRIIHGEVRDDTGSPIAGATIEISSRTTQSDSAGRFVSKVLAGIIGAEISVSAADHIPSRMRLDAQAKEPITITLSRGKRIALQVLDRSQRPVPDLTVWVHTAGALTEFATGGPRPGALRRGITDATGAVFLAGVPDPMDLLLEQQRANAPASRKILQAIPAGSQTVTFESLDPTVGQHSLHVAALDGRTGGPHSGPLHIELTSGQGHRRRTGTGPEMTFPGLAEGLWELQVAAPGLGTVTANVDLRMDQRIEVRLGDGNTLSGQLTSAGPLPDASLEVTLRAVATRSVTTAHTDQQGRFTIAGVQPGAYELTVDPFRSDAAMHQRLRTPQSHASRAAVRVEVTANDPPPLAMLPVVSIKVLRVVVVPTLGELAGQSTWAWAKELRFAVTQEPGSAVYAGGTNYNGSDTAELELAVPEGQYKIRVQRRGVLLGEHTMAAGESWRLVPR